MLLLENDIYAKIGVCFLLLHLVRVLAFTLLIEK